VDLLGIQVVTWYLLFWYLVVLQISQFELIFILNLEHHFTKFRVTCRHFSSVYTRVTTKFSSISRYTIMHGACMGAWYYRVVPGTSRYDRTADLSTSCTCMDKSFIPCSF
jgi:hypothetical protein